VTTKRQHIIRALLAKPEAMRSKGPTASILRRQFRNAKPVRPETLDWSKAIPCFPTLSEES
jgi:hypothetical protein